MTRISQLRSGTLALLLAAGSLTCGENVQPTTATDIEAFAGNGQTGTAGLALPTPLTVLVTDGAGNAVPGVTVNWAAQGGGSVSSPSSKTGSNGHASITRVLGPALGEQTTTASASGLQGSPVTFVATATEGGSLIAISTNPPTSALTREVFDPSVQPVVLVTDGTGNPAAGVVVTASIASGSGTLEGKVTATTDAGGLARFGDLGIEGLGEHTLRFEEGSATVTSSPVNVSALRPEATTGEWGPLVNWDIVPLHMSLMPSGKIVAWGKTEISDTMGMPRVWDPATGPPSSAPMIDVDTMLFCAGHTLMPDGQLMVSGGHLKDGAGIAVTNFFSPDGAWSKGPNMAYGRWYPTVTVLEDGRILTMAGRNQQNEVVRIPEIWEGGRWVELRGANLPGTDGEIPFYPRNFVDPTNGLIFYASERVRSRWFNVDGVGAGGNRGAWTLGPTHIFGFNRDYGSAVMYDVGKILVVGGGGMTSWGTPDPKTSQPTATAEIIDLNAPNPSWQPTRPMAFRRRHMNATVLPDGQVLATGGTSGGGSVLVNIDKALAVHEAELWNPATGQWTTLARNNSNVMRLYHSVSLLLPDGTVLSGASGDAGTIGPGGGEIPVPPERNHEIFSPPYLFKGVRPTITSVPASVGYGQTFSVATPNAAQITGVRWIRLGSVTHAFDASARANTLSFQISGGNVEVMAPLLPRLAPPGHYLLFILNRNDVPSEGKVVRVQ
jgi:galactose oxidase